MVPGTWQTPRNHRVAGAWPALSFTLNAFVGSFGEIFLQGDFCFCPRRTATLDKVLELSLCVWYILNVEKLATDHAFIFSLLFTYLPLGTGWPWTPEPKWYSYQSLQVTEIVDTIYLMEVWGFCARERTLGLTHAKNWVTLPSLHLSLRQRVSLFMKVCQKIALPNWTLTPLVWIGNVSFFIFSFN